MVLAVVIIVLIATLSPGGKTSAKGQLPTVAAPASVVNAVTNIPASTFGAAGKNSPAVSTQDALVALPSSVAPVKSGGKPEIVYMGANYCPYCAAFRWPFVIALSRFGHFTGLHVTGSGSHDVYPNTHTLSFYGSTYSSPYISFSSTELETNVCTNVTSQGCVAYKPLQSASAADQRLFSTYDVKKYFPAAAQASQSNGGWIPFVDYGNKYVESGGFYSPSQLQGFTDADYRERPEASDSRRRSVDPPGGEHLHGTDLSDGRGQARFGLRHCPGAGGDVPPSRSRRNDKTDAMTRWRPITATVVSVLGLAIATYLTYEHYATPTGAPTPACSGAAPAASSTAEP